MNFGGRVEALGLKTEQFMAFSLTSSAKEDDPTQILLLKPNFVAYDTVGSDLIFGALSLPLVIKGLSFL